MGVAETAERAARLVAARLGLPAHDARVLAAASNVLVGLAPSPVVARVFSGTAQLHADVPRWLRAEVAVGAFLGARDLAVAPTALADPGPHEADGLWMTLWQRVEVTRSAHDPAEVGRGLRALHDALRGYEGVLPPLADVHRWLGGLLGRLPAAPAGLREELDAVGTAFAPEGPVQPLHGDASLANLLATPDGPRWADLEDVCVGPVAWDVAGLVVDLRRRGAGEAAVDALLGAYGWEDRDALAPSLRAHAVYDAIWAAHVRRGAEAAGS